MRPPHLRGRCLDGAQVALQRHAPVVVERGHHPGQVGLHQLLPLACNLLLQGLEHRLEVLEGEGGGERGEREVREEKRGERLERGERRGEEREGREERGERGEREVREGREEREREVREERG